MPVPPPTAILDGNGNPQSINSPLNPGRAAASDSRPVVLSAEDFAKIQELIDKLPTLVGGDTPVRLDIPDVLVSGTRNMTALGFATVTWDLRKIPAAVIRLTGTWTGTVTFRTVTNELNANPLTLTAVDRSSTTGNRIGTRTTNGEVLIAGGSFVTLECTTVGTGTLNVSATPLPLAIDGAPSGLNIGGGSVGLNSTNPALNTDSTTNLAANATFTGTSRDGGATASRKIFAATFFADQPRTVVIENSTDNTAWRRATKPLAIAANEADQLSVICTARYHRVVEVNGATAQGTKLITSAYHTV
jgi:hypothetical protein